MLHHQAWVLEACSQGCCWHWRYPRCQGTLMVQPTQWEKYDFPAERD